MQITHAAAHWERIFWKDLVFSSRASAKILFFRARVKQIETQYPKSYEKEDDYSVCSWKEVSELLYQKREKEDTLS